MILLLVLQATVELAIISFYYLLRSGEYTKPRKVKLNGKLVIVTRTQQFRVSDVGFWKYGKILYRHETLKN